MEIEQRLKRLEEEFKILKNQIQNTLLDIQEEVMNRRYPVLRSDGFEPSPEDGPDLMAGGAESRTRGKGAQAERIVEGTPPTAGQPDLTTLAKLIEWSKASATRIGSEGTKEAIELCARGGQLSPEMRSSLSSLLPSNPEEPSRAPAPSELLGAYAELCEILGHSPSLTEAVTLVGETKHG